MEFEESLPLKPPRPSANILLKDVHNLDAGLSLTPEKRKMPCTKAKKKQSTLSEDTEKENLLSKPRINTSNTLEKQLIDCQNEQFDFVKVLKEIQISEKETLNKQSSRLLNFKPNERKYKDLISLEIELEPPLTKPRARFKLPPRKIDKTLKEDIMDFWSTDDFVTEKPRTNFKCDFSSHDWNQVEDDRRTLDFLFEPYTTIYGNSDT